MAASETTWLSILGKPTILIGQDILALIPTDLKQAVPAVRYALVTDENVAALHLATVEQAFADAGITLLIKTIRAGEIHKTRATKESIENWLLEQQCGRDTCIIALGGGVIGDLVGFVAATFMRGVPVVQMPTSLLAMVDSSIGGKTGIDTVHGKNLIGSFHQPARIYIHLAFLKTLPKRHISNGMAEVVKTAAIWDEAKFDRLENTADDVMAGDLTLLMDAIWGSASVKAQVVTEDEREGGLREILNFGHSVGHAVEALMQPGMLHGEAVSIGMVKEAEIARHAGHLSQANLGRLIRCLQAYNLPVVIPSDLGLDDIMAKMAVDKKNKGGKKAIVLLSRIGAVFQRKATIVEDKDILKILSPSICVVPPVATRPAATLTVPGSKSISNRALLLACLGEGPCRIKGLLHSDDTQVMLNALQQLGAEKYRWEEDGAVLEVTGCKGCLHPSEKEVYLGNAGTASRFLTSVCTIVGNHLTEEQAAEIANKRTVITGNLRMQKRPITDLVDALKSNGCDISYLKKEGCLPLSIQPNSLKGGEITLSAQISSQYVSSVLMSAPFAREPVTLKLTGDGVVSEPYIVMTVRMMESFAVSVQHEEGSVSYAIPKSSYKNPKEYLVEADASSATYPLAIAAITGGTITVNGVGSNSLQGDAQFCKVLERMGCRVSQSVTSTTVEGPADGIIRPLSIDMSEMTDAFMTAAVLMAVAPPRSISRITNIANQRVKECNRIAAMVSELGKVGVTARELPDGIEIEGSSPSQLHGAVIECFDDHRIAMSFAVLGCRVPGIVISDKACVEKTYPEFWDDLENKLKIGLVVPDELAQQAGHELREGQRTTAASNNSSGKSIVLIGMRGAGKSNLGLFAAQSLSRDFIDMDTWFERQEKESIMAFVEKNGWPAFRVKEVAHLRAVLSRHMTNAIIACGGGIVETEEGRDVLKKHGLVIQIKRDIDDVVRYLTEDKTRPYLGEPPSEVWKRRSPWYHQHAQFDFVMLKGESDWSAVNRDFVRLVRHVTKTSSPWLPLGGMLKERYLNSFFLSLTFGKVEDALALISTITEGIDALELRVDLLDRHDFDFVAQQVALLRRHSALPIIFTVRTKSQGGRYPDDQEDSLFELLHFGVRLGCEYVDMELCWSLRARNALIKSKLASKLIVSYHDTTGACSWPEMKLKMIEIYHGGDADVVKLVATATTIDDCFALRQAVLEAQINKPTIAICMGANGQLSRALNTFLTPVTHPLLPMKAAPGQLSVKEINQLRFLSGQLPRRNFFLFGTPIAQSLSPLMHNTAFEQLGFPFTYKLCETNDINAVVEATQQADFGGGSVTIPHKETIIPFIQKLTPAAKSIGAVNTILKHEGVLYGDNTDWIGIRDTISAKLKSRPRAGVVIGAGGTARAACYALNQLGVDELIIHNRSLEKATQLALEFNGTICDRLETITYADIIVGTIPAAAQPESYPPALFQRTPIVCDAAYRPRRTPLLLQAERAGCQTIQGVEMLIAQGFGQFRIWTATEPPRDLMTHTVLTRYQQQEQSSD